MKAKKSIHRGEVHRIENELPEHLKHYLPKISKIYLSLFDEEDDYDIESLLNNRGEHTTLGLFFSNQNKLVAFAISGIQTIKINSKTHAVFCAGAYSNLQYKFGNKLFLYALIQSIKYKLKFPRHKLGYLQESTSPAPYSLSSKNTNECYPSIHKPTPDYVHTIIELIKQKRNITWPTNNAYVIKHPKRRSLKNAERILSSKKIKSCKYAQHYLKLNPSFSQGDALLVYIPLSLKNILFGVMKTTMRLITQ